MSTSLMLLFVGLFGVASLMFNSGAWLWMAAKWCRIPNVSYWRALGAVALIAVINIFIQLAGLSLVDWAGRNIGRLLALVGVATFVTLATTTACLTVILRTTKIRALVAGFITLIVSSMVAVPAAIAVRVVVVEAFVVPTGSMALAVIGKHFDENCERCGLAAVVSANERNQMQRHARGLAVDPYAGRPRGSQLCKCANCGYEHPLPEDRLIADGDRILVDKLGQPKRWDVVVHKSPEQLRTKFLTRLVGLPGETVEIIGGDIFINGRREAKPFGAAPEMWILVNDSRYSPGDIRAEDPQWRATSSSSHWRREASGWTFSGATMEPEELLFSGPLTDESFYFERWSDDPPAGADAELQQIGDVQVTCAVKRFSGSGALAFRWEFNGLKAVATLSANGEVELRANGEIRQAHLATRRSSIFEVGIAVRDGVVMLIADGSQVASLTVGPQDAEVARQAIAGAENACQLALTADHCELELTRIVIERDVYYRVDFPECTGCTGRPISLGRQEHFVLGDHSVRAADSRLWQSIDESLTGRYQVGTVPEELMVGVARCIYWPPKRWRDFR